MGKQDGSERTITEGDVDDSGTPFLHIDMDAFFASVEELDDPSLIGKPVIVGGLGGRGVVSAANYVARTYGVNSAMPMSTALRNCPNAIVRRPRFDRYTEISRHVFTILEEFTPRVQPLSIDEAFLDVSGARALLGRPVNIARAIRERVRTELGLAASIGVASSMFVAKVAGSRAKPDGLLCIPASETVEFLAPLPIQALWGVGPVTAKRLRNFGYSTIRDIQNADLEVLGPVLGDRQAAHIRDLACGIDPRQIENHNPEKSIGRSQTFGEDLVDIADMHREILRMSTDVAARARKHDFLAHTVTVTVRYGDWATVTRSRTLTEPTNATKLIASEAYALLGAVDGLERGVRLLGVRLDNLVGEGEIALLWEDETDGHEIDDVVDAVSNRFGMGSVQAASLLRPPRD
ncbi:MAG: DNA polymerase IV [Microbacteriaceae bacterium]